MQRPDTKKSDNSRESGQNRSPRHLVTKSDMKTTLAGLIYLIVPLPTLIRIGSKKNIIGQQSQCIVFWEKQANEELSALSSILGPSRLNQVHTGWAGTRVVVASLAVNRGEGQ